MLAASPSMPDETRLPPMLAACGAEGYEDDYGPQARFGAADAAAGTPASLERLAAGAVAPLPDHGLLAVHGEDATRFLHSQTTNDIERQPLSQARWHGYCTPKGRLLATLLVWRDGSEYRATLSRPLAEAVRKRLAMFVLRAKVRLEDRSDAAAVLGLCGRQAPAALAALGLPVPAPLEVAHRRVEGEQGGAGATISAIGLPPIAAGPDASPLARWLAVMPVESLPAAWARLLEHLRPVDSAAWRWTDVRSGIPRVVPATVEQFVPQMIDFDTVGGVSFDKGCYPGQEIVARAHYLGKVKRRLFLGHAAGTPPPPGAEVRAGSGEPVGMVVLAAPAPGGGADFLFEAQAAGAQAAADLRTGERSILLQPLPYAGERAP